jgi:hypothetical protein
MVQASVKQINISQNKLPNGYLVIRMGKLFENDPIQELNDVIKIKEFTYFAKFGKAIAESKAKQFFEYNNPYFVIVSYDKSKYSAKTFKLLEILKDMPPRGSPYPKYYKGNERFIGSWLKIEESDHQVDINSLIVKSSYQKLSHIMGSAMGSCFFCAVK